MHEDVDCSQTANPSGCVECLQVLPEHSHTHLLECSQWSCWLSGGVSMCSVTKTSSVSLITAGSKGHELHSSGDSLQPPREAAPPLISKVTFSHSNIKQHHITHNPCGQLQSSPGPRLKGARKKNFKNGNWC